MFPRNLLRPACGAWRRLPLTKAYAVLLKNVFWKLMISWNIAVAPVWSRMSWLSPQPMLLKK